MTSDTLYPTCSTPRNNNNDNNKMDEAQMVIFICIPSIIRVMSFKHGYGFVIHRGYHGYGLP